MRDNELFFMQNESNQGPKIIVFFFIGVRYSRLKMMSQTQMTMMTMMMMMMMMMMMTCEYVHLKINI